VLIKLNYSNEIDIKKEV